MKYAVLEPMIDPRPYLGALPKFAASLPPGALAFAADEDHFNFYGTRCVKDLELQDIRYADVEEVALTLLFDGSPWKHEFGLTVHYRDVRSVSIDLHSDVPQGRRRLGGVILDEILPHPSGCRHEIALHGGTVVVVASDLEATWDLSRPVPEPPTYDYRSVD